MHFNLTVCFFVCKIKKKMTEESKLTGDVLNVTKKFVKIKNKNLIHTYLCMCMYVCIYICIEILRNDYQFKI